MCGHVHDELIIECPIDTNVSEICEMMGRTHRGQRGFRSVPMGTNVCFIKRTEI